MITAVPGLIPSTLPDTSTDAKLLVVLQVPPDSRSLKMTVEPAHTEDAPMMDDGPALTVTTADIKQPEPAVYFIVVVPASTPVTTPDDAMVATEVLVLLHAPLPPSLSEVVPPAQVVSVPAIAVGTGLTVTVTVLMQVAVV